jgi:transposase InsO family protein
MPWMEMNPMTQRLRLVAEYLTGDYTVSELARRWSVARPTVYKWIERHSLDGPRGLLDRSHAPHNCPNRVGEEMEELIVACRNEYMKWGPKKLLAKLQQRYPDTIVWPALSTLGDVLKRRGLVVGRKVRRRVEPYTQPFGLSDGPNRIWCADYKGWFRLGNGVRCDPLTITDSHSRYLLCCQAMSRIDYESMQPVFEATLREYGLPDAVRTDNGVPFASRGLCGLSRFTIWLMKLGIVHERIDAGHPEQNGRHERLHRTMLDELDLPASTMRTQQVVFDRWHGVFNNERPHEALGQIPPVSVYTASSRGYPQRLPEAAYPASLQTRRVDLRGVIYWKTNRVFLSEVLSGETVGLEQFDDYSYRAWYMQRYLGVFNAKRLSFTPAKRTGGADAPATPDWAVEMAP